MSNNKKGDKLNFFNIRIFLHQKTLSKEQKDKLQNERKYLQIKYLMGKLYLEYLKDFQNTTVKTKQRKISQFENRKTSINLSLKRIYR